jgi:hypothetical protein
MSVFEQRVLVIALVVSFNQDNLEILAMARFAYNNTMHSSTQQIFFFVNHVLHLKFNIEGVNKVVNPIAKDRTMWLVDVQAQLVFNLEET